MNTLTLVALKVFVLGLVLCPLTSTIDLVVNRS